MSKGVRFTVSLTIAEGKLAEFENVAQAMLAGARAEPGTVCYDWYLSGDRRHCRLLESYVDSDAVLMHLTGPWYSNGCRSFWACPALTVSKFTETPAPRPRRCLPDLERLSS